MNCTNPESLEQLLWDINQEIGDERLAELVVDWVNNAPPSSCSDRLYDIISKSLYNIGVLDQFDPKYCLFVKFPEDASMMKLEKTCPIPSDYLRSQDFRESIIDSIIIDFQFCSYFDSSAISYILKLFNLLKGSERSLEFSGIKERSMISTLRTTKLHDLLKRSYETADDFYRKCCKPTVSYKDEQLLDIYAKKNYTSHMNFEFISRK